MNSKYRIFLLLLILAQGLKMNAQILIGVRAGTTISADYLSPLDNQNIAYGTTFGLIIKHTNQKYMGTQLEFNYGSRGWHNIVNDNSYMSGSVNYAEWKFLTHAQIGKNNTKFTINGGPHLGYLLDGTEKNFIDGVLTSNKYQSGNFPHDQLDYGLVFGFGLVHEFGMGDLQLDINYTLSLSTLTADNTTESYDMRTNQPIAVSLAWLFCPARMRK